MKLEKEINGIKLYINFPVEEILAEISKNRLTWEEEYNQEIGCDYEEVYDFKEEVTKDIDKLIEKISYYQTPNGINELFNLLPLKKNNKLNKTKKPILYTLDYGYYIEDCYGWKTQQLRLAAKNELEAEVYLDSTIIHY